MNVLGTPNLQLIPGSPLFKTSVVVVCQVRVYSRTPCVEAVVHWEVDEKSVQYLVKSPALCNIELDEVYSIK